MSSVRPRYAKPNSLIDCKPALQELNVMDSDAIMISDIDTGRLTLYSNSVKSTSGYSVKSTSGCQTFCKDDPRLSTLPLYLSTVTVYSKLCEWLKE